MQVLRINNTKLRELVKLHDIKNIIHEPIRFVNYRGRIIPVTPVKHSQFKKQERNYRWNLEISKMVNYFVFDCVGQLGIFGCNYLDVSNTLFSVGFSGISCVGTFGTAIYVSRFIVGKINLDNDSRIPVMLPDSKRVILNKTNIEPDSYFIHDKKIWNMLAGENNQDLLHFGKIIQKNNDDKLDDEIDYEIYDL